MKYHLSWLLPVLLLTSASALAQNVSQPQTTTLLLHNSDVLRMVEEGMQPRDIIAKIVTSNCAFDIFPPVLQDLKRRGVPDSVLLTMRTVPYGTPLIQRAPAAAPVPPPENRRIQIPAGTVIRVEAAKAFSSADIDKGNSITFLVSRPVFVNGVLAIDRGAVATAHVVKSKRRGYWGRGGALEFTMQDVVAVDGTRVPIHLSSRVKGNNHITGVTVAAIATGALVFPYAASPVGLIWALKKGDDAVLEQGTKLNATVKGNQEVAGLVPERKKPIYHPVDTKKGNNTSRGSGLSGFNKSFRPTPIRH